MYCGKINFEGRKVQVICETLNTDSKETLHHRAKFAKTPKKGEEEQHIIDNTHSLRKTHWNCTSIQHIEYIKRKLIKIIFKSRIPPKAMSRLNSPEQ